MSLLLDTNVLSELRRPELCHPSVRHWASGIDMREAYVSVITILEIERGITIAGSRDPAYGERLNTWLLRHVLPTYEGRVLPVDLAVARQCAHFGAVQPNKLADALLAATALVHGIVLVTRNEKDVRAFNVPLVNPWGLA